MERGRIYTMGYEGWTVPSLIENLVQNRIRVLVDVRFNPISRRPGFSKRSLSAALAAAGIDYRHERELGNPPENRAAFGKGGDIEAGRQHLREMLAGDSHPAVRRLVALAETDRIAVLCKERSVHACHREMVLEAAQAIDPKLEVITVR